MADLTVYSTAREMVAAVVGKEISARELLDLHLARIAETNPDVNAVVSLDEERARAGAAEADERQARGERLGALHGLPHAFKDTHEVAGWRTTYGSPLRADYVPKRENCKVLETKRTGNKVAYKMACTGKDAMTVAGETTFGANAYEGTMKMSGKADGQSFDMSQTYSGKRVGDCTAPK